MFELNDVAKLNFFNCSFGRFDFKYFVISLAKAGKGFSLGHIFLII
jgi:hypothetical protein